MNELRLLRQKKLKRLIDEVSGGNIADFARKIGKEPSYVARMLYPSDKAGAKPIGEKMALHICHKFVLPLDWFNRDDDGEFIQINNGEEDNIILSVLNIQASAGIGAKNGDVMEVIREIKFNPEQFYNLFRGITPEHIELISVKGDSMEPTFSHGDLLFVDVTIQEYDGDGVYVFTCDDYIFVKRIQKTGRHFTILSDNDRYKPWQLDQEIYIHGKVKVHQSQQLNFIG
ncbi:TPA: helix-turn-helix transcriptional regulator [Mannheimia haemolytica]|nr:helix-turn-helix transcriptional regulator [Mannheimia haemolytica]